MDVIILIGATGTGKTSYAYETWPDLWSMPMNNSWMTNYMGQETVLMDDFGGQISLAQMMQYTDRHPLPGLQAKYRSFSFKSKRLIITTNLEPREWFKEDFAKDDTHKEAMRRRIREFAKIYDCTGSYPNFHRELRTEEFYWYDEQANPSTPTYLVSDAQPYCTQCEEPAAYCLCEANMRADEDDDVTQLERIMHPRRYLNVPEDNDELI